MGAASAAHVLARALSDGPEAGLRRGRNRQTGGTAMQCAFLAVAIIAEVAATSALKTSEGFSRLVASIVVVVGYALALFSMALTLKTIPLVGMAARWPATPSGRAGVVQAHDGLVELRGDKLRATDDAELGVRPCSPRV